METWHSLDAGDQSMVNRCEEEISQDSGVVSVLVIVVLKLKRRHILHVSCCLDVYC